MAVYRQSRNIEASIIDYIGTNLALAFPGIAVEKTFKRVYGIPVDTFNKTGAVCVRLSETIHEQVQIGDNSTHRLPLILIDIFAPNDGIRLDLKDYLVSILRCGVPYYEYEVSGNSIINKTQNGNIRVSTIRDTEVNLSLDKSMLDTHDRYRHLLSLNLSLGKVEV